MEYIISIISLIVFLYSLYVLMKDDYVFIRKSIYLDQLFDLVFLGTICGIILSKIFLVIFHPLFGLSKISQFFSLSTNGAPLTGIVSGSIIAFYLIARFRKIPLGRLFDFLSLALLTSLPILYILSILLVKRNEIIINLFVGVLYVGISIFFWKFILAWLINNKIKEGSMSSLFLFLFSIISFFISFTAKVRASALRIEVEDFFLICILVGSIIVLLKNEKGRILKRKI